MAKFRARVVPHRDVLGDQMYEIESKGLIFWQPYRHKYFGSEEEVVEYLRWLESRPVPSFTGWIYS